MKNAWTRCIGLTVFAAAALLTAQAGLIGMGVRDSEVKAHFAEAVVNNNLPVYPNTKMYYAASPAARVAFVKAFFATVRAYSESAAFKAEYARRRQEAKPAAPEAKGSADQQMSDAQAAQRKQLEETKAQIAKMPPAMQAQMQQMIKQLEDQLNKQASDPQQQAAMKNIYAAQAQGDQEEHQKQMTEWAANFPEQPSGLIAKRLKEFLALTSDINFDAKLETGNGRSRFANPDLENKSSDWKISYRAGREPVMAARALAQDWLHALNQ